MARSALKAEGVDFRMLLLAGLLLAVGFVVGAISAWGSLYAALAQANLNANTLAARIALLEPLVKNRLATVNPFDGSSVAPGAAGATGAPLSTTAEVTALQPGLLASAAAAPPPPSAPAAKPAAPQATPATQAKPKTAERPGERQRPDIAEAIRARARQAAVQPGPAGQASPPAQAPVQAQASAAMPDMPADPTRSVPAQVTASAAASAVTPVTAAEVQEAARRPIEGVKASQIGVSRVEAGAVVLKGGSRIPVGGQFPSGERLLSTDAANGRIVTDQRQVLVFD